jgi:hypothetical protein
MAKNTERIDEPTRAVLPVAVPEAAASTIPATEPLGEPLDIVAIARVIGCSPWTVRQGLIPKGLPCFRATANGKLIFYRQQVVRWILRQQRRQGGPER